MPRSQEKNVSKNIERLSHEAPYSQMPIKQRVAIGYSEARRAGGHPGRKSHARAAAMKEAAENER